MVPGSRNFAGIDYPLLKLDEHTPLLFQWFNSKPERFHDNEVPIINTKDHPYLNNIIQAAKIERDRIIGIFVDGDFSSGQKIALENLEHDYDNIKVIYRSDLDFSMYDKKSSLIYSGRIAALEAEPEHSRDNWLLNELKKILANILATNKEQTLLSRHNSQSGHPWFDLYRNMILLKGSSAFLEAGKTGCHQLRPDGGCIYLDADMVLTGKLGDMTLPEGIAVHKSIEYGKPSLENGIIAVNRRDHPVLRKGMEIMHTDPLADPYYSGLCKALTTHFNVHPKLNYAEFCDFIEFRNENILMNTSRNTRSSWR